MEDLQNERIYSYRIIQSDDAVYEVAKKHGLLNVMEQIFCMEAAGEIPTNGAVSQELITSTFKGNRESERFTCACPERSREYVLSSPTAWGSLMDAILYVATSLTKFDASSNQTTVAFAHRAARDVFATVNLMLVHKQVAEAIFVGERTPSEAKEYGLSLASTLKSVYQNDGEGFAPIEVDHNQTVQANVFKFTAMLSHWYAVLVGSKNPNAFTDVIGFNGHQLIMYETLARPMAEGSIGVGREVTMNETRTLLLNANKRLEKAAKNMK